MSITLKYNHDVGSDRINIEEINKCAELSNIKRLEFTNEFNYNIDGIRHIKTLEIHSGTFNGFIRNCPDLVNISICGYSFDNFIEFSRSLESLKIESSEYNQELHLENTNIKLLSLKCPEFNQIIRVPETLETLIISSYYYEFPLDNFPTSLRTLEFECSETYKHAFDYLPYGIVKFKLNIIKKCSRYDKVGKYTKPLDNIPSSITDLHLIDYFGDLNTIPDSVVTLTLEYSNDLGSEIFYAIRKTIDSTYKLPRNLKYFNYQRDLYNAREKTGAFYRNSDLDMIRILKSKIDFSNIIINSDSP